ncbi:MAG TPA: hypothetical protein VFK11_04550 [Candidatus Saccharimonadales bacterium]|nr:hypothetical protein [Candidatus Saccharimonadales bacterium]
MKLPEEKSEKRKKTKQSSQWLVALCIFTFLVSLMSAGFSAAVLTNMPHEVESYVKAHKQELKGDKGDTGPIGPRGFTGANGLDGTNSYSPTHCSSYGFGDYVSTNCY